jgi:protoheme IX farnesyltransferase
MAAEPAFAVLASYPRPTLSEVFSSYFALAKPEVNFLIAVTAAAAFRLGSSASLWNFPWLLFVNTVLGTLLVASGAGALNQWMEHRFDAKMRRTARRPIAAGSIEPSRAMVFGTIMSMAGVVYLDVAVLPAAALLALLTLVSYLFFYTPLKRRTPLCTLVGAFPGAMPVLIGYVAATGKLAGPAWLLYAILFLWQFPHFMAIAWMYREDYGRAGYRVLPPEKSRDRFVTLQTVVPLFGLLCASLVGITLLRQGTLCSAVSLLLTLGFCYFGIKFVTRRSATDARRLLAASIVYLPALFTVMVFGAS